MFGLSNATTLIQGSAARTWNCVAHFANLLWYKFNNIRQPVMPRSRRRHHSRSRSRSRSHSHDRDRDIKRRKIDNYESPHQRRSVSSEPEILKNTEEDIKNTGSIESVIKTDDNVTAEAPLETEKVQSQIVTPIKDPANKDYDKNSDAESVSPAEIDNIPEEVKDNENDSNSDLMEVDSQDESFNTSLCNSSTLNDSAVTPSEKPDVNQTTKTAEALITPKKALTPKQTQKRLESEKKKLERQKEKEERERKKQEEKEKQLQEKIKMKQEKEEQRRKEQEQKQKEKELKQKEKEMKEEQKRKEKEEKEQKRKEKEEREEQKRKERENEKMKKQQELDEKNKEKLKQVEQMQKSKAVFANFFVSKKTEIPDEKKSEASESSAFMPFEVKSDMRLAPLVRRYLKTEDKEFVSKELEKQNSENNYLVEIRHGKKRGKSYKTWPLDDTSDDVVIVEEADLGESIVDQNAKLEKMKAKYFKFDENQRPPYFGTWRKKSKHIKPRNPFKMDNDLLNYDVDSDDEWEDEGDGESLKGSDDDEEKDESENEYEVDNEFFVPHGHLSDDEIDEEETGKLSPESHKAKLKLLKCEFDEQMKLKTQKIKPRVIGCIWYEKEKKIDEAIDKYLQPFAVIHTGTVTISAKGDASNDNSILKKDKTLSKELVPEFLKLVHGNQNKKRFIINEFMEYLNEKGVTDVSKSSLNKQLKQFAEWMKCPDKSILKNKFCWYVKEEVRKEYDLEITLPNQWKYRSKQTNESN